MQAFNGLSGALPSNGPLGAGPLPGATVNGNAGPASLAGPDFNATAAYLWLLSQQQQQQNATAPASQSPVGGSNGTGNGSSTGNAATNALSALNLTRTLGNLTSSLNVSGNGNTSAADSRKHGLDDSTDEEDEDDDLDDDDAEIRSTRSSNVSESNAFNGCKPDHSLSQLNNNGHNKENKDKDCNGSLPFGQLSSSVGGLVSIGSPALPTSAGSGPNGNGNNSTNNGGLLLGNSLASIGHNIANSDCLESLLRNIEGLVAIAVHNARQQQNQLNMHKGNLIHLSFIFFFFRSAQYLSFII